MPKNKPDIISIGASACGYAEPSQSDDSAELLHTESEYGVEIRSDLWSFMEIIYLFFFYFSIIKKTKQNPSKDSIQ